MVPRPVSDPSTFWTASFPGLLTPAFCLLQVTNAGVRRPRNEATFWMSRPIAYGEPIQLCHTDQI